MAPTMSPHCILPLLALLLALTCAAEQYFLGTHFYVNQDNTIVDNTLKTVSTLARPYDLVTFIRQSERLARVERLQSYIDAVDDVTDGTAGQQRTDTDQTAETTDRCSDFLRDGESLVFKILRTNLYDAFHIPLELKNLSLTQSNEQRPMKVYTCTHFCHIHASLLTFDHLPSISTRYDEQQTIHIDDEDNNGTTTINYNRHAFWALNELHQNRSSWLAYVYLGRYFYSNTSYTNAVNCLRCALVHGSRHEDLVLIELANIVFRHGYIRDAILFIERALDYHLRSKTITVKSVFIRAILHYYLGHLCTIDNRFLLAIRFYNRTSILLERLRKFPDEQQLNLLSSASLGVLSINSLALLSRQKIDALQCHLTLESSLQQKHHILQTKLAQLNELRSITDELIQLNVLIKRDMSTGHSFIEYLRRLKEEQKPIICDWKSTRTATTFNGPIGHALVSAPRKYSTVMRQTRVCPSEDSESFVMRISRRELSDDYDCRPRDTFTTSNNPNSEHSISNERTLMASRLLAIERTQSSYILNYHQHPQVNSFDASEQVTFTSTTTWSTLTSRLPTDVIPKTTNDFVLKNSSALYPPLKQNAILKLDEHQLPKYKDCQTHYFGLPSIGDYPTVWLPLENKGLLNIKQVFYQGLNHPGKHYPLPWSPPLCTLDKPINEHASIIENHPVFKHASRQRAPVNRYDTNMLLNLYFYIDSTIEEQLPIEEFGQRLRAVGETRGQLVPDWIIYVLSSLYWRVNGHLPHAIECGLKAHETIIRAKDYKQWSDLTLVNLANILYLWGKYEDALDLTQQAFRINSHEPITNYLLGNLLALTKNNHTAAQEYYRRTLAIDPTHIYARRQLRLSYCHVMHTAWDVMGCTDNNDHCDEQNIRAASMKCNLLHSHQHYKATDTTTTTTVASTASSYDDRSNPCHPSTVDDRASIDRWLNRSCLISTVKRDELYAEARRAYHSYGLCTSSVQNNRNNECTQGFAVTNQGVDIGHVLIIYDYLKQTFDYSFFFTNDYENFFLKESKLKCLIFGTGRKSSKCRDVSLNMIDPNQINPKHNMTWWRDPSTLYEHLKELIEIMNYEQRLSNNTSVHQHDFYERYVSDAYILSKQLQDKYLLKNVVQLNRHGCRNKSLVTFTPYLSTWISPQTKNIVLNASFFKQLKKSNPPAMEPICTLPVGEQMNHTKNSPLINYILTKANRNLTLYRSETILKTVLTSLLFEKNPTSTNREGDDRTLIGSMLASGLTMPAYNTSWLFLHTVSLYWRLMGNASQALNCLVQSHVFAPATVHDFSYLSMALILYNSQLHTNEAIYFLYESLSSDRHALVLTHFTLGNAMARKGRLDLAEQWYQSSLKLKSDFEPAKQRLRAIQCS